MTFRIVGVVGGAGTVHVDILVFTVALVAVVVQGPPQEMMHEGVDQLLSGVPAVALISRPSAAVCWSTPEYVSVPYVRCLCPYMNQFLDSSA